MDSPINVEVNVSFDDFGDAAVHLTLGSVTHVMPAGDAEKLAAYLTTGAAVAKVKGAIFRELTLQGWDPEGALSIIQGSLPGGTPG